ncbi:unnamed protein product [Trichobilharzia szidati]|nr:unnamed protein product [Trichobilharzia szidati]
MKWNLSRTHKPHNYPSRLPMSTQTSNVNVKEESADRSRTHKPRIYPSHLSTSTQTSSLNVEEASSKRSRTHKQHYYPSHLPMSSRNSNVNVKAEESPSDFPISHVHSNSNHINRIQNATVIFSNNQNENGYHL